MATQSTLTTSGTDIINQSRRAPCSMFIVCLLCAAIKSFREEASNTETTYVRQRQRIQETSSMLKGTRKYKSHFTESGLDYETYLHFQRF